MPTTTTSPLAPAVKHRTPVIVLTGFLGSGKTSLLNALLRDPAMARTLVVINEFGAVGIDHDLVAAATDEDVVELENGCVCCTLRHDLVRTLLDARWRFARNGQRWFDRVIVETTGLADPVGVVGPLLQPGELARSFRLQAVITTVDAVNAMATLTAFPEAVKQVAVADRLLLTKTDLASPAQADVLRARLANINPGAAILDVARGEVTAEAWAAAGADIVDWLNAAAYQQSEQPDVAGSAGITAAGARRLAVAPATDPDADAVLAPDGGQHVDADQRLSHDVGPGRADDLVAHADGHGDHAGHDHDHDHGDHAASAIHDDGVHAFCLIAEKPVAAAAIDAWLQALLTFRGADLLRVKGIIHVAEMPVPMVVHCVQHIVHPPEVLPAWPSADRRTRIVFITRHLAESDLRASFAAVCGDGA